VANTTAVRQAKLKPECAERYPTLPARMWTSAIWVAELVASYRGARPEPRKPNEERTLSETDFEFRGGSSASGAGGLPERASMSQPF
jgi:hypothetical protein